MMGFQGVWPNKKRHIFRGDLTVMLHFAPVSFLNAVKFLTSKYNLILTNPPMLALLRSMGYCWAIAQRNSDPRHTE